MKKYLGVDWGEKRIGLAIANSELKMALPFKTISSLAELLTLIETEEIDELILGQPIKLSGQAADNPQWLEFVKKLNQLSQVKVRLVDERLSSLAADALFSGLKEQAPRDETAAMIILQNYLDAN
ncbi:MAG: Holliday junction resolvase RuvX [Patescibacteria group bacterium]|jgi:putative Holliday junction resolvase